MVFTLKRSRLLYWTPLPFAALLALGVVFQPFVEPRLLYADPLVAGMESGECCKIWYGAMSTLGALIWAGAAAICLFAALLIRLSAKAPPRGARADLFLLFAGLFTGWLVLDDVYQVHEAFAPGLGIPQNLILAVYALLALAYLWTGRRLILASSWALLGAAFAGFGLSVGLDVVLEAPGDRLEAIEDAGKFVGIVAWTMFHAAAGLEALAEER